MSQFGRKRGVILQVQGQIMTPPELRFFLSRQFPCRQLSSAPYLSFRSPCYTDR